MYNQLISFSFLKCKNGKKKKKKDTMLPNKLSICKPPADTHIILDV